MSSRPFGVTLVAIIAWVTGAIGVVQGVFTLLGGQVTVGVIAIVLGLIVILVSGGLFGGTPGARMLVTVVFLLNIGASIYAMIAQPSSLWSALAGMVFPLIGLLLLYTGRANQFFKKTA